VDVCNIIRDVEWRVMAVKMGKFRKSVLISRLKWNIALNLKKNAGFPYARERCSQTIADAFVAIPHTI